MRHIWKALLAVLLLEDAFPSAELLRENKRMLDKAIRDLDRERMGLQNQEKKLVAEIKKTAKQGQMVLPPSASPVLQRCYDAGRCQ